MACRQAPWAVLLLAATLLLLQGVPAASGHVGLEGFDEPALTEAEQQQRQQQQQQQQQASTGPSAADRAASHTAGGQPAGVGADSHAAGSGSSGPAARPPTRPPQPVVMGKYETAALGFLVLYLINLVWGRARNQRIARAWSAAFTGPDSIFDKNFSHCEPLMQEAGNVYKFYASGRRHVQGMLATLQLKARQDVLALLWGVLSPSEDCVVVEALMTEASMPPLVLAVALPRVMRRLAAAQPDLAQFTRRVQPAKDALPGWNHDKLHIHAEHSTIVSELFSEARVLQALSPTGPHARSFKYFRSLHFTNECSEGAYKRVLRFTFALPPPGAMEDLAPLLALVPLFIDLVGTYKLSPDLKKKAEAARAKAAEAAEKEEEARRARMEQLAQRKQEKLAEEKARIARLPPAERQKAEEKLQKRMMDKAMKKRIKKI